MKLTWWIYPLPSTQNIQYVLTTYIYIYIYVCVHICRKIIYIYIERERDRYIYIYIYIYILGCLQISNHKPNPKIYPSLAPPQIWTEVSYSQLWKSILPHIGSESLIWGVCVCAAWCRYDFRSSISRMYMPGCISGPPASRMYKACIIWRSSTSGPCMPIVTHF